MLVGISVEEHSVRAEAREKSEAHDDSEGHTCGSDPIERHRTRKYDVATQRECEDDDRPNQGPRVDRHEEQAEGGEDDKDHQRHNRCTEQHQRPNMKGKEHRSSNRREGPDPAASCC